VTIVCHNYGQKITTEPDVATVLRDGDNLFVFTTSERLIPLIEYGLKPAPPGEAEGLVLVCGLGHTGYRVVTNLVGLGRKAVAVDPEVGRLSERLSNEFGVTVKYGDPRWQSTLLGAGLEQATALVACTDDDMTNLQIALRARACKPSLRVVMRIFDDNLGQQIRQTFGINAVFSSSALALPDFISATLNRMNVRLVDIAGIEQAIVRLQVAMSALYDAPISELQAEEGLTVLLHARQNQVNIPPVQPTRLRVGDEIVVMAAPSKLEDLNRRNKSLRELKVEEDG
jgi:Trk K+ transport system NAD-binding subunit